MSIQSIWYRWRVIVLTYPNKILKKVSKPLKEIPPSIQGLARDMFDTMYDKRGIGLAAPQVGELIRLIVIDVPKVDPIDPEKVTPDPLALINPEIITGEGDVPSDEGCLSCPELIVTVQRRKKVAVSYLDLGGRDCRASWEGLKGICVQHEIDHLNGVLLVDRLTKLDREQYKKNRLRIAKDGKEVVNIL